MRYLALATDYDGTLAHDGSVDTTTVQALERARASGRKLIMVTGRELEDLIKVFPRLDLFDRIVAENGALLYRPAAREEKLLCDPYPPRFVQALRDKGVFPLSAGRAIVATVEPYEKQALDAIHELGLELHVVFNKGSVMVLPSGINKATGLKAALDELGLSAHNVVGAGDAENDHAFLSASGCAAAVANALPALKERADIVTRGARGAGVTELIDRMLGDDLLGVSARLNRHAVLVGKRPDGAEERIDPMGTNFLVAGTSGSGKSTVTAGILERLCDASYQYAIIDPEGDYTTLEDAVVVGDAHREPSAQEILDLLKKPGENVVVNLLGVPLEERPRYFRELLPRLVETRARTGRPHLIVVDEVHHLLPAARGPEPATPPPSTGMLYITVHPASVDPPVLAPVGVLLVTGQSPQETVADFSAAARRLAPAVEPRPLGPGEVLLWRPGSGLDPVRIQSEPPRAERRRHSRKYAEGNLGPDRNFVFTGPAGKLNLRAQNLAVFLQMAGGVDDETWLYHLRRGDYSDWFRKEIKDEELANEAADIEGQADQLPPAEMRAALRAAVERRYTLPADKASGKVTPVSERGA
jgi:hydroxymethylpyrimidine pyrophosphatase-like HAD family hydrolase